MVDVVITYVDSSDKHWVEAYNRCVQNPLENVQNRFRSYDCLDLQIKLIRKYMKFVENIFVVVSSESQVPESIKGLENIHIVLHSQIIPRRYLPCFNSCTIEMYLYNIKKLSEKFIYFNDDIFPINELKEEDFFIDDKIVIDFTEVEYEEEFANAFQKNVMNSTRLFNKSANKFIKPAHSCFPAIKSHIINVVSHNINEIQKSLTRTRHSKNINFYAFINNEILKNNFIKKETSLRFFTTLDNVKDIYDCIKENKTKFICVNDNDNYNFENWKQEFRNVLECSLDRRKTIKFNDNIKSITFNKVVATFTSWTKRIYNCKDVVINLLNQSLKPDLIYLNLSISEFPNKELDLPIDLVELSKNEKSFIINWVDGPNTKTFKKVFPILQYLDDDDLIFWTDDDLILPKDTLKSRVEDVKKYSQPICGISKNQSSSVIYKKGFNEVFGINKIVGSTACSIAQVKMLKGFDYIKSDEIISLFNDDIIYATLCYLNGYDFHPCSDCSVWRNKEVDTKDFVRFMIDKVSLSSTVNNNYSQNSVQTLNEVKIMLERNKHNILSNDIFKLSRYFSFIKPKIVIYSCCLNNTNHKAFQKIKFTDNNLTYIMYTDDNRFYENEIIDGWKIAKPKSIFRIVQDVNKDIKWHPFIMFSNSDYDISMYIDSKVDILVNPNEIILDVIDKLKYGFTCSIYDYRPKSHPNNDDDIYKHIDYLLWFFIERQKNPSYKYKDNMLKWKDMLLSENYPEYSGVLETAVVLTNLHNKTANILENKIFDKYKEVNTLRDQIVIPYVLWKNNINIKDCGLLGNYCTDKHYFINNFKTNVNGR